MGSVLRVAVESGVLENIFPGYEDLMHGLHGDPSSLPLRRAEDFSCETYSKDSAKSGRPMMVYGETGIFDCYLQSYFIFSDGQEKDGDIEIKNTGFLLWMPADGRDNIRSTAGYSLTVLNQNWGHKKIEKQCSDYRSYNATKTLVRSFEVETFGGVGLLFSLRDDAFTVVGYAEEGAYLKDRISVGDQLVAVDGKRMENVQQEEVIGWIRGKPDTEVALTFLKKGAAPPMEYSIKAQRKSITRAVKLLPRTPTLFVQNKYFDNVVLFGPGIEAEDLVEERRGYWVHKKTGDTIETPPCFSFVFMKDVTPKQ